MAVADIALSQEQKDAVDADVRRLCVVACAGSGKTTVLTERLVRLALGRQIDPARTVAITFTVLAANELRLRLGRMLPNPGDVTSMFIGTIHGFCLDLLHTVWPGGDEWDVLSEGQQFLLINAHWDDWNIAAAAADADRTQFVSRLVATFDIISTERIGIGALRSKQPLLADIYERYRAELDARQRLDYAGIIDRVRTLLTIDTEFRAAVQARCGFLFVDEYQDVDPAQERIIQVLADNATLFVVGDDDQSLYQFRGADVRHIVTFKDRYADGRTLNLTENRRCRDNIVRVASGIVELNAVRAAKTTRAHDAGGRVSSSQFASVADEAAAIADEIRGLKRSGAVASYGEVAVLLRSVSSYGSVYIDALRKAEIPYIAKGDRAFLRRPEIQGVVACLEFVAKQPPVVGALLELVPLFNELPPGIDQQLDQPLDAVTVGEFVDLGFTAPQAAVMAGLRIVGRRYERGQFGSLLEIVFEVFHVLEAFRPRQSDAIGFNLALLTQIVTEYEEITLGTKLGPLCGYLKTFVSREYDEGTPIERRRDSVNVLTIHQAKGLEFDAVFCPMLVERRFPSDHRAKRWLLADDLFDARRYRTGIEDERRLFYVATTRARSFLYLSAANDVGLKAPVVASDFFVAAAKVALSADRTVSPATPPDELVDEELVTSYSSMEYYLTCPYRYKLVRYFGVRTPSNPFFQFGVAVHRVLRQMHERQVIGEPLTDEWIEEAFTRAFQPQTRVPPVVLAQRRAAGLRALRAHRDSGRVAETVEVERPFDHAVGGALVRGRIDAILSDGVGYEVIDFKTGKPHEYLRTDFQMQVYALATAEQLALPVRRATLIYVEHPGEGLDKTYAVDDPFLAAGRSTLTAVVDGIRAGRFEATPGSVCSRCEFRVFCSFAAR